VQKQKQNGERQASKASLLQSQHKLASVSLFFLSCFVIHPSPILDLEYEHELGSSNLNECQKSLLYFATFLGFCIINILYFSLGIQVWHNMNIIQNTSSQSRTDGRPAVAVEKHRLLLWTQFNPLRSLRMAPAAATSTWAPRGQGWLADEIQYIQIRYLYPN
jgi:hypothetical protein